MNRRTFLKTSAGVATNPIGPQPVLPMNFDYTAFNGTSTDRNTTSSNSPFRMSMKNPSVTRISGALRINRKGRTNALRIPSKSEAPINAATLS